MSWVGTGGGLVLCGHVNGASEHFDDETAEVLWAINLGSAVTGFPITYAVDGQHFVAVSTGTAEPALGFIRLTPTPSREQSVRISVAADVRGIRWSLEDSSLPSPSARSSVSSRGYVKQGLGVRSRS